MKINKQLSILSVVTMIALSGCSQSDGHNQSGESVTGVFADGAIGNAEYKCGSTTGFTNVKGEFTCPVGSKVDFYYANFHIGGVTTLPSDKIILIQDALDVPRAHTYDENVIRLAVFLQSLDKDEDHSNGIFLDPSFKPDVTVGTTIKDLTQTKMSEIITKAGKTEVSQFEAQKILQATTDNVIDHGTIDPTPTPSCRTKLLGVYYNGALVSAENMITISMDSNLTLAFSKATAIGDVVITPTSGVSIGAKEQSADANVSFMYKATQVLNTDQTKDFNGTNGLSVKVGDCTFTPDVNIFSHPFTRNELEALISASKTAQISAANTANITDMSDMFYGALEFNQNISSWDTSSVTNMGSMFYGASNFNQSISAWNTSSVTDMSYMFQGASAFNQNVSVWNTSSVTNMSTMFAGAKVFNQNLSAWDTSSVTNMSGMFITTTAFNQNLSDWNTSSVTNMNRMFQEATAFDQNITSWNVNAVTNHYYFSLDTNENWTADKQPIFH